MITYRCSAQQLEILIYLYKHPDTDPGAIAKLLMIERRHVFVYMARIIPLGYVDATKSSWKRVIYNITPKGREVVEYVKGLLV